MKSAHFDEIVFLDNFFRSSDNLLSSHPANRRFLFRAFGLPAGRLGVPCREVFARSEGGALDVAAMMRALELPQGPPGWAKTCVADLSPLLALALMPRFTPGTLVIGWGMPPSLMHLLDQQGVSFLDIEIAPVRFTSHLSFCARTNDRLIETALENWRIDDEAYWSEATVLQGYFSRRSAPDLFHRDLRVGLFCGQSAIDLALVRNGEIARPVEVLDAVRTLAKEVDLLVIKPHPYEPDLGQLVELAAGIPNVAWSDANFYALLCADNLRFVCGLSSGALHEASYFMKEALQLIEPDRNNRSRLPASCSDWISVGPGIASLAFLKSLCAEPATPPGTRASRFPDDALDRIFGIRWGLDAQNAGLRELPALEPGRTYALRDGTLPTGWLSAGWDIPKGAGVPCTAARACIVIPLKEGSWPDAASPSIRINGKRCQPSKDGFSLSARLDRATAPRVLVLEIEVADRQRFQLLDLCVRVGSGNWPALTPLVAIPDAVPSRRMAAAAAGLVLVAAALLATSLERAQAQVEADASRWTLIKHLVVTSVHAISDDLHTLLQRHEV